MRQRVVDLSEPSNPQTHKTQNVKFVCWKSEERKGTRTWPGIKLGLGWDWHWDLEETWDCTDCLPGCKHRKYNNGSVSATTTAIPPAAGLCICLFVCQKKQFTCKITQVSCKFHLFFASSKARKKKGEIIPGLRCHRANGSSIRLRLYSAAISAIYGDSLQNSSIMKSLGGKPCFVLLGFLFSYAQSYFDLLSLCVFLFFFFLEN